MHGPVISEIAQFTASNLSYDNDSAKCGVAIIGNFSKMTKRPVANSVSIAGSLAA